MIAQEFTVPDQSKFKFDTHDLEIIHHAVSRWSAANGYDLGQPKSLIAARQAFLLYQEGMEEDELLEKLQQLLCQRH